MKEQLQRRHDDAIISNAEFPDTPEDWTPHYARALAEKENLRLTEAHWEVLRALQNYYAQHKDAVPYLSELKHALENKFASQGGGKYLQTLFPGGPVAQGCRLAGLNAPAGAVDKGFGSVV
ncbi:MAG: TusE/DsrC/DsvC family sulfur relay protein [Gammaproteobacteria bacterium]|nr:TusE/DsrC/DsvC family sulfur relay protein [Gammaproteobacteria bacterium]